MKLIACCMVSDEEDVIEPVLRHLVAEGCDEVIVSDNLSTDDTPAILAALKDEGLPLVIRQDDDPAYEQARKMTALARSAAARGADWVLPFDADEVFYSDAGRLADVLEPSPPELGVLEVHGWDHLAKDDTGGLSPWRRDDPQVWPKVMFRPATGATLAMGNHSVQHPGVVGQGPVNFRHFQYRTVGQYARKVRQGAEAYALTSMGPEEGAHWKADAALDDAGLRERWEGLCAEATVFDPAPIRGPYTASVVIPTLGDRPGMLDGCVRSVAQTAPDAQIVVEVDSDREGFAVTCNRGAKNASGDLIVFLNDDTVCHPGWLDALARRKAWGIVGANLTYPDGTTQHTGVSFPAAHQRRTGELLAVNRTSPAPSGEVAAVTGACMAVRRDVWDSLGGFDDGYLNGYEDVDLCLRAREAGHRVFYAQDARVIHLESQSPGRFDHAQENVARLQERWGWLSVT